MQSYIKKSLIWSEKFDDTKGIIRRHKSKKDRQYIGQNKYMYCDDDGHFGFLIKQPY